MSVALMLIAATIPFEPLARCEAAVHSDLVNAGAACARPAHDPGSLWHGDDVKPACAKAASLARRLSPEMRDSLVREFDQRAAVCRSAKPDRANSDRLWN